MNFQLPIAAFTDLDDTLFSTLRKQKAPHLDTELHPHAYLKDGAPISYSNAKQRALQHYLAAAARVIPVTARSISAFKRVNIPFSSYAVVSHGACVLLPDGTPDLTWRKQMQPLLEAARLPLDDAIKTLVNSEQNASGALRVTLVEEHGQALYALVKHGDADEAVIAELARTCARPWVLANAGFQLHVNGNNLAIIPPGINKAVAVRYVAALLANELGEFVSIGLGDSLTDGGFMLDCDYYLVPNGSQLAHALRVHLDHAHVHV